VQQRPALLCCGGWRIRRGACAGVTAAPPRRHTALLPCSKYRASGAGDSGAVCNQSSPLNRPGPATAQETLHQLRAARGARTGAGLLLARLPAVLHAPSALALALLAMPPEPHVRAAVYAELVGEAESGEPLLAPLPVSCTAWGAAPHTRRSLCATSLSDRCTVVYEELQR
jgi:hypothetical protein